MLARVIEIATCLSVRPSVRLSVRLSVRPSRAGIVSKQRKVALNSALISASCFTTLTETTFAPKPEVALRVYCVAVRSAILATAWLLVTRATLC